MIVEDLIHSILEKSKRSIFGERLDNHCFWAWRENTEENMPWIEAKPQNVARLKEQSRLLRQGPFGWFGRFIQLNPNNWWTTQVPVFKDRSSFCWFGDKERVSTGGARLPSGFQVEGVDLAQLVSFPSKLMLYRICPLFGIFWKEHERDWFESAKSWRVRLRIRGTNKSKLIVQGPLPEGEVTCTYWGHQKDKDLAVQLLKFLMDKDGCLIGQRVSGREFGYLNLTQMTVRV